MLLMFLERQSMFKRKKALPTWIQNVDLGQKRVCDRNWVLVITIFFLFGGPFIGDIFLSFFGRRLSSFRESEEYIIITKINYSTCDTVRNHR